MTVSDGERRRVHDRDRGDHGRETGRHFDTEGFTRGLRAVAALSVRDALHEWRIHGQGDSHLWLSAYADELEARR